MTQCTISGAGVVQNDSIAFDWIRKAAGRGHAEAKNLLRAVRFEAGDIR